MVPWADGWHGYDDTFGGKMRLGDVVAEASTFSPDPRRAKHSWMWDMVVAIILATVDKK